MLYLSRKPLPPLSDFVDALWLYEGYDVPHEKERLLPDGSVELVINLAEDSIRVYDSHDPQKSYTIPGCVVSGPRSEFFVIDTAGEASIVGVHFKPGGAFPFFADPPGRVPISVGRAGVFVGSSLGSASPPPAGGSDSSKQITGSRVLFAGAVEKTSGTASGGRFCVASTL